MVSVYKKHECNKNIKGVENERAVKYAIEKGGRVRDAEEVRDSKLLQGIHGRGGSIGLSELHVTGHWVSRSAQQ